MLRHAIAKLLVVTTGLLLGCDAGDGDSPAPTPRSESVTESTRPGWETPNLEQFVGVWELHQYWDADGEPWENGALWYEMVLHEDGRFESQTQWISDDTVEAPDFREAALLHVVQDQMGVRIESRGLWTAVWDGETGELALSLRFDERGAANGSSESDNDNNETTPEAKRDVTLRAQLLGQGGRFLRLAGHPVHRGVGRVQLRRVE